MDLIDSLVPLFVLAGLIATLVTTFLIFENACRQNPYLTSIFVCLLVTFLLVFLTPPKKWENQEKEPDFIIIGAGKNAENIKEKLSEKEFPFHDVQPEIDAKRSFSERFRDNVDVLCQFATALFTAIGAVVLLMFILGFIIMLFEQYPGFMICIIGAFVITVLFFTPKPTLQSWNEPFLAVKVPTPHPDISSKGVESLGSGRFPLHEEKPFQQKGSLCTDASKPCTGSSTVCGIPAVPCSDTSFCIGVNLTRHDSCDPKTGICSMILTVNKPVPEPEFCWIFTDGLQNFSFGGFDQFCLLEDADLYARSISEISLEQHFLGCNSVFCHFDFSEKEEDDISYVEFPRNFLRSKSNPNHTKIDEMFPRIVGNTTEYVYFFNGLNNLTIFGIERFYPDFGICDPLDYVFSCWNENEVMMDCVGLSCIITNKTMEKSSEFHRSFLRQKLWDNDDHHRLHYCDDDDGDDEIVWRSQTKGDTLFGSYNQPPDIIFTHINEENFSWPEIHAPHVNPWSRLLKQGGTHQTNPLNYENIEDEQDGSEYFEPETICNLTESGQRRCYQSGRSIILNLVFIEYGINDSHCGPSCLPVSMDRKTFYFYKPPHEEMFIPRYCELKNCPQNQRLAGEIQCNMYLDNCTKLKFYAAPVTPENIFTYENIKFDPIVASDVQSYTRCNTSFWGWRFCEESLSGKTIYMSLFLVDQCLNGSSFGPSCSGNIAQQTKFYIYRPCGPTICFDERLCQLEFCPKHQQFLGEITCNKFLQNCANLTFYPEKVTIDDISNNTPFKNTTNTTTEKNCSDHGECSITLIIGFTVFWGFILAWFFGLLLCMGIRQDQRCMEIPQESIPTPPVQPELETIVPEETAPMDQDQPPVVTTIQDYLDQKNRLHKQLNQIYGFSKNFVL